MTAVLLTAEKAAPVNASWLLLVTVLANVICGCRFAYAVDFATGSGVIPFWLGVYANQQLDPQVTAMLTGSSAFVALRFHTPPSASRFERIKILNQLQNATGRPVLIYGCVSHSLGKKDTGNEMMSWLSSKTALQLADAGGRRMQRFGDVAAPEYRALAAASIRRVLDRYGADGVAVDLAVRTPSPVPNQIARRCAAELGFCDSYAEGMDALFGDLRTALGARKKILYNGLWNFREGMVQDQARLLESADAAIVEYFGQRPNKGRGSFSNDIAPYLTAMDSLAEGKKLYAYGRGPWSYENYREDYLRQRYLYGAYLLAANRNTAFKYHSSFQIPAHAGRSGGLDLYADWFAPLGEPLEPYKAEANLLTRRFTHGRVIVAPDDAASSSYRLDRPMYSLEGKTYKGALLIDPGRALILFDKPPLRRNPINFALKPLAAWDAANWIAAHPTDGYLTLTPTENPALEGDHDLLLDAVRTFSPREVLELRVRSANAPARLLLVAEVDDVKGQHSYAVVCAASRPDSSCPPALAAPLFRRPTKRLGKKWPSVIGPVLLPGEWQNLTLVGDRLLEDTRYRFRRWVYARIDGAMAVASVTLRDKEQP